VADREGFESKCSWPVLLESFGKNLSKKAVYGRGYVSLPPRYKTGMTLPALRLWLPQALPYEHCAYMQCQAGVKEAWS